jgi:hypothetical protein
MTFLYRLLLVLSSISVTGAVFLVNKRVSVFEMANEWLVGLAPKSILINWTPPEEILAACSYAFYFLVSFGLSVAVFRATKWLPTEQIDNGSFKSIELVNDTFVPVYLAYFFVALSTTSNSSFLLIFGIILVFVYRSGGAYFDPIYILRGYKIYAAVSRADVKSFIITRQILKGVADLKFENLCRINDFTFIEVGSAK